jgi:hypothetical protein
MMRLLNFSTPFNTQLSNISQVMTTISKAPGGGSNAGNNLALPFLDGALLASDDELFGFGGTTVKTDSGDAPDGDSVLGYMAYWSGAPDKVFSPGFVEDRLPSDVSRYVTYGAGASAPSEGKAWYFSGMRTQSGGEMYFPSGNGSLNPSVMSTSLIQVDMSTQLAERWSNSSLPPWIPGRAGAEMVWVPRGEQGILVVLGGVINPVWAYPSRSLNFTQQNASEFQSPTFFSNIDIYDIASGLWHSQKTTGGPGQLAQFCAVVASAEDGSSHNIYLYGGFDGMHLDKDSSFNDDVWILSLPSFTWMRVARGTDSHARAGHKCVKAGADMMMVVGGYTPMTGSELKCLEGGVIQVFNLSSLQWQTSYSPTNGHNYSVPDPIYQMIGGTAEGGATVTAPAKWAEEQLAEIMGTPYKKPIKKWYPYPLAETTNNTRPTAPPPLSSGGGVPKFLAPLLGVLLGLAFVGALIALFFILRRRNIRKNSALRGSDAGDSGGRASEIMAWVRGDTHLSDMKSQLSSSQLSSDTNTLDGLDRSSSPRSGGSDYNGWKSMYSVDESPAVEAGSETIHELADTSQVQELSATNTGFSYFSPSNGAGGISPSPVTPGAYRTPSPMSPGETSSNGSTPRPQRNSSWLSPITEVASPVDFPDNARADSPTEGVGSTEADVARR